MSQIQPLDPVNVPAPAVALARGRPRRKRAGCRRLPGWLRLLLSNPKSRGGIIVLSGDHRRWRSSRRGSRTHDPNDFSLLDATQSPSWHHLFGTTDQGSDIFSQVVWGARTSLVLGAAAAALATVLAATLGILAAYCGGMGRRRHQPRHERLPRHPHDPAADRRLVLPAHEPWPLTMMLDPRPDAVGVRGAHPARAGAHAAQPRLHPRCEGGRRGDLAHRLRRARCRT